MNWILRPLYWAWDGLGRVVDRVGLLIRRKQG